jgi:hypothetical protein
MSSWPVFPRCSVAQGGCQACTAADQDLAQNAHQGQHRLPQGLDIMLPHLDGKAVKPRDTLVYFRFPLEPVFIL